MRSASNFLYNSQLPERVSFTLLRGLCCVHTIVNIVFNSIEEEGLYLSDAFAFC